ncbi:uncharacterized protein LODBEIA_P18760 [Lodderomyces beijingensis]|uniref:Uncharacterized protein n=1 Tax=Lodderomyces beijingensis TaxID=1775926 RepID=A0ABP0ZN84_9ASCO
MKSILVFSFAVIISTFLPAVIAIDRQLYDELVRQLANGEIEPTPNHDKDTRIEFAFDDGQVNFRFSKHFKSNGTDLTLAVQLLRHALSGEQYLDAVILYDHITRDGYTGNYVSGTENAELAVSVKQMGLDLAQHLHSSSNPDIRRVFEQIAEADGATGGAGDSDKNGFKEDIPKADTPATTVVPAAAVPAVKSSSSANTSAAKSSSSANTSAAKSSSSTNTSAEKSSSSINTSAEKSSSSVVKRPATSSATAPPPGVLVLGNPGRHILTWFRYGI